MIQSRGEHDGASVVGLVHIGLWRCAKMSQIQRRPGRSSQSRLYSKSVSRPTSIQECLEASQVLACCSFVLTFLLQCC
eukprot:UN05908